MKEWNDTMNLISLVLFWLTIAKNKTCFSKLFLLLVKLLN